MLQTQPPACLTWSLGLGVDEALRVGLQEGVEHTRDSSSLALEQSSVYVLVSYQRGIVTGSPGPATPTPEPPHRGCLVRPPRGKVGSWNEAAYLQCGHACQSHFYKMFFLEEESVVNGSFSRIQLLACFFVLFLIQPSRPALLCSGPTEVGKKKEVTSRNLKLCGWPRTWPRISVPSHLPPRNMQTTKLICSVSDG